MILKVRKVGMGWIMIGNVERLNYEVLNEKDIEGCKQHVNESQMKTGENHGVVISYHIGNVVKTILTNMRAYLLNDVGKTIEKIY